jgi:hypothetical protein
MTFDRLQGDLQLTGDLAVGAAFGGQPDDAQLAGGQRVRHGRRGRTPAALSSSRAQAASGRAPQRAAR